jgi:hypothetical protein
MGWLELYIIFALATAISACYEIVRPAMSLVDASDSLKKNPIATYLVMFMFGLVLAPVIVPVIFIPALTDAAIRGLVNKKA